MSIIDRFREARPATNHHYLDHCSSELVEGWAVSSGGVAEVVVESGGLEVGRGAVERSRPDVHAVHPKHAGSEKSGFSLFLDDSRLASPIAELDISLIGTDGAVQRLAPERVFVPRDMDLADPPRIPPSPFPRAVSSLLTQLHGADSTWQSWDSGTLEGVLEDLAFAVRRGPQGIPGITPYLGFLRRMRSHFEFVERHFPRRNHDREAGDKDAVGIASSSAEMLSIAHHLYVLKSWGMKGRLLEFGCFKGFSTSCLSTACHDLGIGMDVFDSFQGLPASESTYHLAGDFAGSLDEVRANVSDLGRLDVVEFHPGFFSDSLPGRVVEPLAIWMDVDIDTSARDVMTIFDQLPAESCVFTHECLPDFFQGDDIVVAPAPDAVLPPILDAFAKAGRRPRGRWLAGATGALWDERVGHPVLGPEHILSITDLA